MEGKNSIQGLRVTKNPKEQRNATSCVKSCRFNLSQIFGVKAECLCCQKVHCSLPD